MHQLTFDSIYGVVNGITFVDDSTISVHNHPVHITHCKSPIEIPWKQYDVAVVYECSGEFTTSSQCQGHLTAGCKRVIVTAPSSDIPMVCRCVREKVEPMVTIASSSTCCLAPLLHLLSSLAPIDYVSYTVIHSVTSQQQVTDRPLPQELDKRIGRAAGLNIIPVMSSAYHCLPILLPWLKGRLYGQSVHVPSFNGCLAEVSVHFSDSVALQTVVHCIQNAAHNEMKGVLDMTDEDVVSSDFVKCSVSCVVDKKLLHLDSHGHLHLSCWFDDDWSYCSRAIDFGHFYVYYKQKKAIYMGLGHFYMHSPAVPETCAGTASSECLLSTQEPSTKDSAQHSQFQMKESLKQVLQQSSRRWK